LLNTDSAVTVRYSRDERIVDVGRGEAPFHPDLRAMPISNVFDAYDTDSFAAFLQTLDGVVVQKIRRGSAS
jgi:ferric-dicitrate binding protein FerR (iron transport regulator)